MRYLVRGFKKAPAIKAFDNVNIVNCLFCHDRDPCLIFGHESGGVIHPVVLHQQLVERLPDAVNHLEGDNLALVVEVVLDEERAHLQQVSIISI